MTHYIGARALLIFSALGLLAYTAGEFVESRNHGAAAAILNAACGDQQSIVRTAYVWTKESLGPTPRLPSDLRECSLTLVVTLSPLQARRWLELAILQDSSGKVPTPYLRMSYLTGPVPEADILRRLRLVTATTAASDDEIRLFAASDIRLILLHGPPASAELETIYRGATADGQRFLVETTKIYDPKVGADLERT